MALLITLFLVLINIFNNITTNSPKAEGLTAIEIWMLACILFVFGKYTALQTQPLHKAYTVFFQKFKYQKKQPVLILHPRPSKSSQLPKTKRISEILLGKLEIIQFILVDKDMDGPGQGLRHFLSKNVQEAFIVLNQKSFGQKNF